MVERISKWINSGKGIKKETKQFIVFTLAISIIAGGIGGFAGLVGGSSTKIDPCECIKISSKKDLGLSYNESDWNKCVDTYYSVDNLFTECVSKE